VLLTATAGVLAVGHSPIHSRSRQGNRRVIIAEIIIPTQSPIQDEIIKLSTTTIVVV
jgi:hypothetical protein